MQYKGMCKRGYRTKGVKERNYKRTPHKTLLFTLGGVARPFTEPLRWENGSGDMAIPNLFCRTYSAVVNYQE